MEVADKEEIVRRCTEMFEEIIGDITVPRNIRRSTGEVKDKLRNGDASLSVRVAAVISDLDELATNQNIPSHTRALVWNIVSQLETIAVED
ncbi:hypothetical protein C5S30_06440 [ANME-1 cluster archaeon GoMg4]|nr:hypothetical protein [ANME-1 cluster archaeon GoMg4]